MTPVWCKKTFGIPPTYSLRDSRKEYWRILPQQFERDLKICLKIPKNNKSKKKKKGLNLDNCLEYQINRSNANNNPSSILKLNWIEFDLVPIEGYGFVAIKPRPGASIRQDDVPVGPTGAALALPVSFPAESNVRHVHRFEGAGQLRAMPTFSQSTRRSYQTVEVTSLLSWFHSSHYVDWVTLIKITDNWNWLDCFSQFSNTHRHTKW